MALRPLLTPRHKDFRGREVAPRGPAGSPPRNQRRRMVPHPPYTRRSTRKQSRTRCVGRDVHKAPLAVASVAPAPGAEVPSLGPLGPPPGCHRSAHPHKALAGHTSALCLCRGPLWRLALSLATERCASGAAESGSDAGADAVSGRLHPPCPHGQPPRQKQGRMPSVYNKAKQSPEFSVFSSRLEMTWGFG
jgi:hypothetical protein